MIIRGMERMTGPKNKKNRKVVIELFKKYVIVERKSKSRDQVRRYVYSWGQCMHNWMTWIICVSYSMTINDAFARGCTYGYVTT